jgi:polyphosphate glucokinase
MAARSPAATKQSAAKSVRTLAIDVGGSGIKAITLDEKGEPLTERVRVPTPRPATPRAVVRGISKLAKLQADFDRVSLGFPGVVKDGVIYTAPNLGPGWTSFDLQKTLQKKLGHPVRVANDAAVQGAGAVSGHGLELVITLGTGFGSALFAEGRRIPLELGHHPFHKGKTYEQELGARALKRKGKKRWNALLREAIDELKRTFNYDRLYIGGGNAKFIRFDLPDGVTVVSNIDGLLGGIALWNEPDTRSAPKPPRGRRLAPLRAAKGAANSEPEGMKELEAAQVDPDTE